MQLTCVRRTKEGTVPQIVLVKEFWLLAEKVSGFPFRQINHHVYIWPPLTNKNVSIYAMKAYWGTGGTAPLNLHSTLALHSGPLILPSNFNAQIKFQRRFWSTIKFLSSVKSRGSFPAFLRNILHTR